MEIYSHLNHRVNGLSGNIPPKLPPIILSLLSSASSNN
jgi:hypothetical protein